MKTNYPTEKDDLLKYCLKDINITWNVNVIKQNILQEISIEEIRKILFEIKQYEKPVANVSISKIRSNGYTEKFLDNGGFTKIAELEYEKELKTSERETLEINLAKSNLEANILNKKIAIQNRKNEKQNRVSTWINIGIGIINVGLLIWQILKPE